MKRHANERGTCFQRRLGLDALNGIYDRPEVRTKERQGILIKGRCIEGLSFGEVELTHRLF